MGLGMFYPPHVQWERIAMHDARFPTCCLLAVAPRFARETRVSYSIVTTVLTNIHMCFPYPIPRHPLTVLFGPFTAFASGLCAVARRMFNRGFAHPNYSECTHSRGHFVPEVVSV